MKIWENDQTFEYIDLTESNTIFRLSTSLFQGHSEWPTSGYSLLERGVLFDLGFYSTPLVCMNLLFLFYGIFRINTKLN